jgi:hypothetical protein
MKPSPAARVWRILYAVHNAHLACSSFGTLLVSCDTSIYLRAARYKAVDTSEPEAAEAAL